MSTIRLAGDANMPVKVQVPPNLRQHTEGQSVVEVEGSTIATVLEALQARYPGAAGKLIEKGSLRRTLNVFLNNEDIRILGGLSAPVRDGDEVAVIPTVSGGALEDEEEGEEDEEGIIPEGAAVFPEIPAELGVSPLLLTSVHAMVFLAGSERQIVHPDAAEEVIQQMASYMQRLEGPDLRRVREDMAALEGYARKMKWPKGLILALRSLLTDLGVGVEEEGALEGDEDEE
jgi:MoaD family protein